MSKSVKTLKPLTKAKLLYQLKKLGELDWNEKPGEPERHWQADKALLAFINDKAVTKAFCQISRWYE